jgi:SAM-dependent methyltransferase
MPPIHLCVMQPAGHVHALAFLDPARYLRWQLRRLGATVTLAKNRLREDALNIVFGAHLGFPREWTERHACVFFNLEQLGAGGATLDAAYLELLRTAAVVDYDAANVEAYVRAAADVPVVPLLHAPYLDTPGALPLEQRPIDLLFVGTLNPRRQALLDRIEAAGCRVATFDHPVYGPERDAFVRQAKAVLNCAYYASSRFEQVRVAHALSLGTPVISLRPAGPLPHAAFEQSVCWLEDNAADAGIEAFFRERFATPAFFDDARARLAAWRTHDARDAYAELLAFAAGVFRGHARTRASGPWRPPYVNLGSGKDYKPGWLNLDILERAEPDLVLDLGRAQTFPIETKTRFGSALRLEAGSVQAIVANNVLEHVPDLPQLMGNALALLAEGGLFEIEVPYEKAPTAWQDPTHLRALNEQSWLYYTEWFWYLGWFEHRFEIVRSAWLDASGVRECEPHAAQFMRVTLRKIATTAHERTIARAWQPDFGGLPDDEQVEPPAEALPGSERTLEIALDGRSALAAAAPHYQRLMDEGLMPHAVQACAERVVVSARPVFAPAAGDAPTLRGRVAVVVPCTRQDQFEANVQRSPGLLEFDARIVQVWDAASPADAVEQALPHCAGAEWILLCHQDVYFAKGFAAHLASVLDDIAPAQRRHVLVGFAGLGVDDRGVVAPAGFVIDRLHCFDHEASLRAVSIDELALVFAADSVHRIDPALGWHLWATDLCLSAITQHRVFPRIVRAPLFHNSENDHTLPDAFHASARVLAAKHAAWGPIATLCGTIEPPPAPAPAAQTFDDARVDDTHALHLPAAEAALARLVDEGQINAALALTVRAVHQTYRRSEIAHRALYYPGLDAQLARLALPHEGTAARGEGGTLIVATELYAIGGHSRVLEDLAREVERPRVVLTDLFDTLHAEPASLQALRERLHPVPIEVLAPGTYEAKARALAARAAALDPARIFHFGHHQDPLPLVALLRHPAPQWVVHHADHNPSLGPTLSGLGHIDCTASLREICARSLARPAHRLPLHVSDRGVARWPQPVRGRGFSVATSGHAAKFARDGAVALQAIVRATLSAIDGRFFHIGPLDDAWRDEIRSHLAAHGLDADRFVALGSVPSVWQALKDCGAAFYIGSAPVSGGRAAVEAQGCGLPVLCFTGFAADSLLADFSSYADPGALGWRDVHELTQRLAEVGARHAALSAQARRFYEREFSRARLRAAVRALESLGPDHEKAGNPAAVLALA